MVTKNTQTPSSRPNFFILLGLNPDAPWDPVVFEQVLGEKQRAWSVQRNSVAKIALVAKQNMEYIPQIKTVMADERLRQEEAAAARLILVNERDAKANEFEKQSSLSMPRIR